MNTELPFWIHALFILYLQLVTLVVALPIIFGLAGGHWPVAAGGGVLFLLLAIPPGKVLHARRLRAMSRV